MEKASLLEGCLEAGDASVRLWAAWSLLLCAPGHPLALRTLSLFIPPEAIDGGHAAIAVDMSARSLKPIAGREFYRALREQGHARLALLAAHAGGWPEVMDDVVAQMVDGSVARLAGLVFMQITGLDLGYHDLDQDPPPDLAEHEGADPRDTRLPWPSPERVALRWQKERGKYSAGARYLRGEVISEVSTNETLRIGTQPQRRAAAIEKARLRPSTAVYPTARSGLEQARELLGWL